MQKCDDPHLCGGTFFTLLLQAIKQRYKARDRQNGGSDGLKDTDVLIGLIRIAKPEYITPAQTTFAQNTSAYKACSISDSTYLPFGDSAFVTAFDKRVKKEYPTALAAMSGFVNSYIAIGSNCKHVWLTKALLELIQSDRSILDGERFFVSEDGSFMDKAALNTVSAICLPALLLGVWHFIVMNRRDNTVGRATFESWHEKPETKGQQWKYISQIGDGVVYDIHVTIPSVANANDEVVTTEEKDNRIPENTEPYVEHHASAPILNTTTQVINSPAVFFNSGANCIQINNTGNLSIDRGGKP